MSRRRKLTDTTPFDTVWLEGTRFVPELQEPKRHQLFELVLLRITQVPAKEKP